MIAVVVVGQTFIFSLSVLKKKLSYYDCCVAISVVFMQKTLLYSNILKVYINMKLGILA
jgi:hypothetical protein